jgi:uncharacterized UBP type Zn finger protein
MFGPSPKKGEETQKMTPTEDIAARKRKRSAVEDESVEEADVRALRDMGFNAADAASALKASKGSVDAAVDALLTSSTGSNVEVISLSPLKSTEKSKKSSTRAINSQPITNFFAAKKST